MIRYKNLIAAGCSFVHGGTLTTTHDKSDPNRNTLSDEEKRELCFATNLGNLLNTNTINLASQGGSNDKAIRLIYEWIKLNEILVPDTVFVIGLTEVLRSEKYSNIVDKYLQWRSTGFFSDDRNAYHLTKDTQRHKLLPNNTEFHRYVEQNNYTQDLLDYIKTDILLFTDIGYEMTRLSRNIDLLNTFIRSRGSKLIVFSAMLELDKEVSQEFGIFGKLNTTELNFFTFPDGSKCWKTYIKSYDKKYDWGDHPNIKDDKILSELLYDYIQTL